IVPPDVNESELCWKGNGRSMRVGLLSISELGTATRRRIVAKREEEKYKHITDFLMRVKPEENEARAMIHAGAFDRVHAGESRASLLWMLACSRKMRGKENSRQGLFEVRPHTLKPSLPPESDIKRLRSEFAVLGFLCGCHPMELYREALKRFRVVRAGEIHRFVGKHVRIAGLLVTGKVVHTKQGDPMEFLTFEDETGLVETVFFPKTYRRFCAMLDRTRPFVLSGKVEEDFGAQTLTVSHVEAVSKGVL
ncbi:MAG: DNA polymerase III subunit alpha, partial [Deltaproteobacteria bacterium]|nr:DNA polymerase III subunit alpha [Deltaproteobacteria bacterium]